MYDALDERKLLRKKKKKERDSKRCSQKEGLLCCVTVSLRWFLTHSGGGMLFIRRDRLKIR